MKITELLELHEQGKTENLKELISIKTYMPVPEKLRIADVVIDASAEYDRGYIKFDTYKKYLAFVFATIEAHTALEFAMGWDERIAEYDVLCEKGLFKHIIEGFQDSYDDCWFVLNMKCNDLLADNSVEANMAKIAQSVIENLDVFAGTLSDKLAEIDLKKIIPEDLDLNKLQKFLNRLK